MARNYNLQGLYELMGNDANEVRNMLKMFVELIPELCNNMRGAADIEDWTKVAELAHKLKSTLRLMSIESILDTTITLEKNARAMVETEKLPGKVYVIWEKINQIVIEMNEDIELMGKPKDEDLGQ